MALANWSFIPLLSSYPPSVFPNVALWNVSNGIGLEYQIQISWPFNWPSRDVESTALTMYNLPLALSDFSLSIDNQNVQVCP